MSGYDENGRIYTLDLWCMYAGWEGGTIHDALRAFSDLPMKEKDAFCNILVNAIDNGHLKDLESGWATLFTRARIGLD